MDQDIAKARADSSTKQKVTIEEYLRVGDNSPAFFVGFQKKGGTEYLIMEKNGEKEPKPGTYSVENRHRISSFDLFKEEDGWYMETTMKAENGLPS